MKRLGTLLLAIAMVFSMAPWSLVVEAAATTVDGNSAAVETLPGATVAPGGLAITRQPESVYVPDGTDVTIDFEVQGDGLTYKWYFRNGTTGDFYVTNTFKSNFYTTTVNSTRNGRQIYCVVTDKYGNSVQTDTVSLNIRKVVDSGECGENVTWELDNGGTLSIFGEGPMVDVLDFASVMDIESVKRVVVLDGVTTISDNAFYEFPNLTEAVIPGSVTTIGFHAFAFCYNLAEVAIENGVTEIEESAFCYSGLTRLVIPDSVTTLGWSAFAGCNNITDLTIGSGITEISNEAFFNCGSLKEVVIPDNVITIGSNAFAFCSGMSNVVIGDGVTTIGTEAFDNCKGLSSITIGSNVTTIGRDAFWYCHGLTDVYITDVNAWCNINFASHKSNPMNLAGTMHILNADGEEIADIELDSTVTKIPAYAFEGDGITSILIPDSVTSIGESAFAGSKTLINVSMGSGINEIGDFAFYYCSNLESVMIPENAVSIGEHAFGICEGLTQITMPESVTSIGEYAFYESNNITDVYYGGTEEQWNAITVGEYNDALLNATIHFAGENSETTVPGETYPEEELPVLELDVPTQVTINEAYGDVRFQFTPAESGKYVFESAGDMDTKCDLYDSEKNWLTSADDTDYDYNFKLTYELEAGKTYYFVASFSGSSTGSYTFTLKQWNPWPVTGQCGDNLTWELTADGVLTITGYGNMWGYGSDSIPWREYAQNITSVVFPDGITNICNYAFQGCTNLKEINIPEGVTYIGLFAFDGCTGLSEVTLPSSITAMDNYAFKDCTALTKATISEGFTWIPWGMFSGCSALTTVTIPGSVTEIREYAFEGCTSLTDVYYGSSEGKWMRNVWVSDCENGALDNATFHFAPATVVAEGNCGDNLTWVLTDDGKLAISGTGDMWDFGWDASPWNSDRNDIYAVILSDGITTIGDHAFLGCHNASEITIPEGITNIGTFAFCDCGGITQLTIPDSVITIEYSAFRNCYNLTQVTIGSGVTEIGNEAFAYCNQLVNIQVSANNTAYASDESGVLYNRDKTVLIKAPVALSGAYVIDNGVAEISNNAFESCKNLTQITIPDSVTNIYDHAFRDCTNLETIIIGSGLSYIGWNGVFGGCNSLTGIYVDGANTSFSSDSYGVLFNKDKTELIKAPAKLTGRYDIPGTVTSIRNNAFYNCDALTEVSIPNGVRTIGYDAFNDCDGITGITIPESVERIESSAFANCEQLTNVYLLADNCSFGYGVFSWSNNVKYNTYDNANYFGTPENPYRMLMSVTAQDITACTIHPDTKVIAGSAFNDCRNLTEIVIPEGVTTIGDSAFQNCSVLAKITIADTVTKIGSQAFDYCYALAEIKLPSSLTQLGGYAFRECDSLTEIVIPEGITFIGHSTFAQCDSLSKVTLPDSITSMDNTVFENCTALTQIVLPEGISEVSWGTFSGCTALTTVTIPSSVTSINGQAFSGCTALTDVYFGGTQDMWDYDVRIEYGNEALSNATIHCAPMATIVANKNTIARIREAGQKAYFAFTPKESGKYIFNSLGYNGVAGAIYDADMNELATDNDGDGRLSVSYEMTAGTTYILGTWYMYEDNRGNYTVKVMKAITLEDTTPITLNQNYPVSITERGTTVYFSFTPAKSCNYLFSASSNGQDTKGWLYDANFNQLTENDDRFNLDFGISYYLQAGTTYILGAGYLASDMAGTFNVTLMEEPPFHYMMQNGEVIITGSSEMMEIVQVPETIMGYPVTGINDLGWNAMRFAKEIIIPDSVTRMGYFFWNYGYLPLEKLTLGSGISEIPYGLIQNATNLQEIVISDNNPYMVCVDGAVYTKDMTTLLYYPPAKEGTYIVPDSVTDLSVLFENWSVYSHLDIQFGAGTNFVMEDGIIYNADKTVIIACSTEKTGSYTMPDSVTQINPHAFMDSQLSHITMSSGITQLVYAEFAGCIGLESIDLPENLQTIGSNTFDNCRNLMKIEIPVSVEAMGMGAFASCYSLHSVLISDMSAWCGIYFEDAASNPLCFAHNLYLNDEHVDYLQIPNDVTNIGQYAFYHCNMISADIPANVRTISTQAFYGTQLRQVTLAEGLQEIGYRAFESSHLQSVTLPDSLTIMSGNAFANCADLETVHIGAGLTTISWFAFANAGLKKVTLPTNIASVEESAFRDCQHLTEVIFENDAINIGYSAFYGCPLRALDLGANATIDATAFQGTAMTTVTMPENITDITYRSFAYCENLISVVIPESVQSINTYAFEGDYNLHHVLYKGDQAQWDALGVDSAELINANLHLNAKGDEIAIIDSCYEVQHYCAICDVWETVQKSVPTHTFENDVCIDCGAVANWEYDIHPDGTAVIFGYHGQEKEIEIPATLQGAPVTMIAGYAFWQSDVYSVKIPASVRVIGDSVFEECYNLNAVTFETGSQLQIIAPNAFAYCESLTGIKIPEGTLEIGDRAFYGSGLKTAAIADTVHFIGERAFANCYHLGNISIGSGVEHIGMNAFTSCYSLGTVELPANLQILDSGAFQECICLQSVVIPNGISYLGSSVFYGCNLLESVTLPAGIDFIGNQMFDGCESLTSINIPESVTAIGYQAFRNTGLQNIELPENVSSIDYEAFSYCYNLEEVTVGANLQTVGTFSFGGCAALNNVYYNGTAEQWYSIWFEGGNDYLLDAQRHYVSTLRITRQPRSVAVPVGTRAEVSFEAQGEGLVYQWYFKNKGGDKFYPTSSFTGNTYSVTMDATRDGRQIYCVVTDKDGNTVRTNTVTLSIGTEVVIDSGICGVNATWKLNDQGVLTISGAGPMADYNYGEETPWQKYDGMSNNLEELYIREIVVEEGITTVGAFAFKDCQWVEKATLPNSLVEIHDLAFDFCLNLKEIVLPENLTMIGACAFQCCESLAQINIPASVVEIFDYAFVSCGQLTGIWVDENNANYSSDAYGVLFNKDKTQLLMAPGALSGTYSVAEGVQDIWSNAFVTCYNLEEVVIPASVTSLSSGAFSYCKVTVSEDNTAYASDENGVLFNKKMTRLIYAPGSLEGAYSIPEGVVSIGNEAFNGCEGLTNVIIPNSVTTIGNYAFIGCWRLEQITIPDSVTTIGEIAFAYCESMKSITIGSGVIRIGQGAFLDCFGLTDVYYCGNAQQWNNMIVGEGNDLLYKAAFHYICETLGHTFKEYVSNNDATCEADGTKTAKCAYCDATDTIVDEGSALGHNFTENVADAYLQSAANCENAAVYFHSCSVCGEIGKTTFTYGEALGHSFTNYISNNDATTEADGTKTAKCDRCDATDTIVDEGTKLPSAAIVITKQPVSVTVADGKNVVVSFTAEGEGLTYKWYYKNKGVSTFTLTTTFKGNSYNTTMNASRAGRELYCVVTDKYGNSVQTDTVTISMLAENKLEITKQPVSVAVVEGEKAIVTFTAKGEGLTYKWYFKEANSSKFYVTSTFKSNTYSATMNAARDGRQVYCVVTDTYGNSVTTDTVTLRIAKVAKITKQPVSVAVAEGERAIVTFEAEGDGLTYQWYFKNAGTSKFYPTSTFKGNSYDMEMTSAKAGREIYCVITDAYGNSVTTDTVKLGLEEARTELKITKQPVSMAVADGESVTVSFTAQGDGLTYKWYYKNKGASKFSVTTTFKSNSYNTTMNESRDGREVYCVVTDKYGNSIQTDTVTISIEAAKTELVILQQPVSVVVAEGERATVTFEAQGDGLTYKWYFKDTTASKFYVTNTFKSNTYSAVITSEKNGRQVYCVVTDAYGNSVTTDTVTLSIEVDNTVDKGTCGENLTWKLDDAGVLTISGTGAMTDYENNSPWKGNETIVKVVVAEGVTSIGAGAFVDCFCINEVSLSSTVEHIGEKAFAGCYSLGEIALPENLKSIDSRAFMDCITMGEITIPNSVTYLGENVFEYCNLLESVTLPQNIEYISNGMFNLCASLTEIKIPVSVTSIGENAFNSCENLTDVYYEDSAAKWGKVSIGVGNDCLLNATLHCKQTVANIIKQPESMTVAYGETVIVTIEAEGDGLTYEWYYRNGTTGKFYLTQSFKGNSYSVEMNATRSGRQIYCVVTDQYGNSVQTETVTLRGTK